MLRLWEVGAAEGIHYDVSHFLSQVLWTDYYSNNFVLFVALAVLESHRDVILRYLVEVSVISSFAKTISST